MIGLCHMISENAKKRIRAAAKRVNEDYGVIFAVDDSFQIVNGAVIVSTKKPAFESLNWEKMPEDSLDQCIKNICSN